jgi:general secretion pathway protein C
MAARTPRRILLALAALVPIAVVVAWAVARRPEPAPAPEIAHALPEPSAPPAARSATAPIAEAPENAEIPHTKLPLRLLGTLVNENPALSLATVEDTERTLHEVMKNGQHFEGRPTVQVASIERARILIDNDGVREQLVLDRDAPPEAAEVSPEELEHRRDVAQRLRALTDAGANYRDVLGEGQREGLLAAGDASPVYEDGEMVGVQFDGIREGGVYDRIGLRNGDVVTEINGISLGDPAAAAKVMGQFVESPELHIAVERGADGKPETIVVPVTSLWTALEELDPSK